MPASGGANIGALPLGPQPLGDPDSILDPTRLVCRQSAAHSICRQHAGKENFHATGRVLAM
jgi:hypothetical protein